jgi:hypothetical protein
MKSHFGERAVQQRDGTELKNEFNLIIFHWYGYDS